MSPITQLAHSMDVTEGDVRALAQSVVNSLQQDKVDVAYSDMTEDDQVKMIQAYAVSAHKKMTRFTTTYQTNPEARQVFQHDVLNKLKESTQ